MSRLVSRISNTITLAKNPNPNTNKKVRIGNFSKFENFPEYDTSTHFSELYFSSSMFQSERLLFDMRLQKKIGHIKPTSNFPATAS
jgi:hypothetical protein